MTTTPGGGGRATAAPRSCAGPGSSTTPAGTPEWIKADRPIADTDLVLWHVGIHHITRPEDGR